MHQSSLENPIVNALRYSKDGFYTSKEESQQGKSNSQGGSDHPWFGTTEPVKRTNPHKRGDQ